MISIYSTRGLRIFFLRIALISMGILALMGGIYFGLKDRFDIVACLILGVSNSSIMLLFIAGTPRKRRRERPYNNYDVEHLAEQYDEGFIDAITGYINNGLNQVDQDYIGKDLVYAQAKTFCTIGNSMDKVKLLGQLQIREVENKIMVVFCSRDKKTGTIS